MSAKYTIKAGETFSLKLTVVQGSTQDKSSVASIYPVIKKAAQNSSVPPHEVPSVAEFTVSDLSNGWVFTLDSATTRAMGPGQYIMDARLLTTANTTLITDPVLITIRGSVS